MAHRRLSDDKVRRSIASGLVSFAHRLLPNATMHSDLSMEFGVERSLSQTGWQIQTSLGGKTNERI